MAMNLSMDIGKLVKDIKQNGNKGSGVNSKSYIVAFACITLIILAVVAFIYQIYLPLYHDTEAKKTRISDLLKKQNQIVELDTQIRSLEKGIDKSKADYLQSLSYFSNSNNLEDLYQSMSTLANKYNLTVLNIKEAPEDKKPAPATNNAKKKPAPKEIGTKTAAIAKKNSAKLNVQEIKVDVELKGRYSDYIKFKEDLSIAEMLLNINKESISVSSDVLEPGIVYGKINLSTYAIDKRSFQGILGTVEQLEQKTIPTENAPVEIKKDKTINKNGNVNKEDNHVGAIS